MNKRVIWGAAACILIPYTTTLAWTGSIQGEEFRCEQQKEAGTGKRILLDRGTGIYYMDIEEYLPGVLARQIPVSYEPEAIFAGKWSRREQRRLRNPRWIWIGWKRSS